MLRTIRIILILSKFCCNFNNVSQYHEDLAMQTIKLLLNSTWLRALHHPASTLLPNNISFKYQITWGQYLENDNCWKFPRLQFRVFKSLPFCKRIHKFYQWTKLRNVKMNGLATSSGTTNGRTCEGLVKVGVCKWLWHPRVTFLFQIYC